MGLIRKSLSLTSMGVVDFQSDKERTARSARLTKQAIRAQTRAINHQTRSNQSAAASTAAWIAPHESVSVQQIMPPSGAIPADKIMATVEAGWYPEPSGAPLYRWWSGYRWMEHTKPMPIEQLAPPNEQ
jgi:hypothetical protein